ncbi:hypothetical protein AVEN_69086-1 [Araneus ventricosus]|uniref:Uncharacterized protein n=1 Tax=Araneus ventricosus TaxID=182803 RepID=A0A4Y2MEK8_ARAVE|nr:hypothetical protein AVEN_69086-1 [Araneus ventricosus]
MEVWIPRALPVHTACIYICKSHHSKSSGSEYFQVQGRCSIRLFAVRPWVGDRRHQLRHSVGSLEKYQISVGVVVEVWRGRSQIRRLPSPMLTAFKITRSVQSRPLLLQKRDVNITN